MKQQRSEATVVQNDPITSITHLLATNQAKTIVKGDMAQEKGQTAHGSPPRGIWKNV
jgi:hypothetical protein